jgi:VanZ family protein
MVVLSLYVLFAPTTGGPQLFTGSDKLVHLVLFALLAGTARGLFGPSAPVLVAVAVYAAGSELVQGALLDSRSGDPYDVLADLLGALVGWRVAGDLRGRARRELRS